jgi:DNA (cytosine-5)-methyltransferase 1
MRELSLFSGAGGGLLGTHLLGWRPVGYVEIDDYCQRVIAARIRDGILPAAPIFGDVKAFNCDGYAAAYSGLVDVVTGGFPCQPFSLAGKRQGAADERNGWPATIECLRVVRPEWALLENVPGLLTSGYFGTILGDLAESGFDCRWRILSAAEVGAPHRRDRLWIVAHNDDNRRWHRQDHRQKDSTLQRHSQGLPMP